MCDGVIESNAGEEKTEVAEIMGERGRRESKCVFLGGEGV